VPRDDHPEAAIVTTRSRFVATLTLCAIGRVSAAEPPQDPGPDDARPPRPGEATDVTNVTDVRELSLADLLDTRVDIASKKPQTARETPGIVTVITRDDIISSGARELLDVLVLVPGFSPGVDVEGVVDLGVRGQWGHEGKIVLLIDGQPMNELLYSSLQLGNHYPLESIDHIEVIRGPGSAIYGGYAELAVINIITRGAASLEGVAVAGSYGQLGNTAGHANASLSFGTTSTGIKDLSAAGSLAIGHASSGGTYRDFAGGAYAMDGNSAVDPLFVKLAINYRRLHIDAIVDQYAIQTRDGYGPVSAATVREGFHAYALDVRYELALQDHLTLTPRFDVVRQTPWQITDASSVMFYDKTISRYTAALTLSYDPTKQINLLAGAETYSDRAHLNDIRIVGSQTLFGDQPDIAYDTIATYAQLLADHRIANLTLGVRYEHHSAVGNSFVPRIALTKVIGRFHAKLLASQAFRAPGVENINLSPGALRPEKTTVFEAEAGYEIGEHMFAVVNAFDTTIKKPIIYDYNQATMTEAYQNFDRTGTRGVEVDYRVKYPRGSADINYSYYTAAGKNAVDAYRVPGHDSVLLAFPAHKVAMSGSLHLYRGLSFNPSAVIYGERYGYLTGDADGNAVLGRKAPTALVNLYLLYRDVLVPGLELGAGIYDVADQHYQYLQPYNGGHPPMPAAGREVVFRVAYEHKL
jgi:outer membrane receptor for ferrienterochelin and colicin